MKKIISLLLACVMALSLCACGDSAKKETAASAYELLNSAYEIVNAFSEDVYDAWHAGIFKDDNMSAAVLAENSNLSEDEISDSLSYLAWKYMTRFASKDDYDCSFEAWFVLDEEVRDMFVEQITTLFNMIDIGVLSGGYPGICHEMVVTAYTFNGKLDEAKSKLAEAMELIKELEGMDSKYEYLGNLKAYYTAISSLLESSESPEGSLVQFSETQNEYKNSAKENASALEFAF